MANLAYAFGDDDWDWYIENGVCAFCNHATHDFPEDSWHEEKHGLGWHSCEIHGGFRHNKPGCPDMDVSGAARLTAMMNDD